VDVETRNRLDERAEDRLAGNLDDLLDPPDRRRDERRALRMGVSSAVPGTADFIVDPHPERSARSSAQTSPDPNSFPPPPKRTASADPRFHFAERLCPSPRSWRQCTHSGRRRLLEEDGTRARMRFSAATEQRSLISAGLRSSLDRCWAQSPRLAPAIETKPESRAGKHAIANSPTAHHRVVAGRTICVT
jgi:hypothetical protein